MSDKSTPFAKDRKAGNVEKFPRREHSQPVIQGKPLQPESEFPVAHDVAIHKPRKTYAMPDRTQQSGSGRKRFKPQDLQNDLPRSENLVIGKPAGGNLAVSDRLRFGTATGLGEMIPFLSAGQYLHQLRAGESLVHVSAESLHPESAMPSTKRTKVKHNTTNHRDLVSDPRNVFGNVGTKGSPFAVFAGEKPRRVVAVDESIHQVIEMVTEGQAGTIRKLSATNRTLSDQVSDLDFQLREMTVKRNRWRLLSWVSPLLMVAIILAAIAAISQLSAQ